MPSAFAEQISRTDMATIAPAQLPTLGALPERFTVDVTRLDIAWGVCESGNFCPVASAVKRALDALGIRYLTLDVDGTNCDLLLGTGQPWIRYRHDAGDFVRLFDSHEHVGPRAVTLWRAAA